LMSGNARKNVNRGFKKLRVWNNAVELYMLACKILSDFPFELKKIVSNSLDAAHSMNRNIAEGYCRRSLKEYLNYLNFALGSCGEFHACYESFRRAGQISEEDFEKLDEVHYKVENELIKLIRILQKKQGNEGWQETFLPE
jgi:four helix bundle protein